MIDEARWSAVLELLAQGDPLSPDDEAFVEATRASDRACSAEIAFFEQLSGAVDGAKEPLPDSQGFVREALARVDVPSGGDVAAEPVVEAEVPSDRRRWLWGAAAAVGAVAAALLVWTASVRTSESAPSDVRLTVATGEVYVDGRPAASSATVLSEESTVAVKEGTACFWLDRNVDVCLHGATTASLHGVDASAQWVEVHRGRAVARLEPLERNRTFALGTSGVRATAVGTIFSLDVDEDGSRVTAAVLQGVVEFEVASVTHRLAANEVAVVEDSQVHRRPLSAEEEGRELALLSMVERARDAELGQLAIECVPEHAMVVLDGTEVGTCPVVASVPAGEHRIVLRADGEERVQETLTVEADALVHRRLEVRTPPESAAEVPAEPELVADEPEVEQNVADADGVLPKSRKTRTRPVKPAHQLLSEARQQRQAGRWKAAAESYKTLRAQHPRSTEAQTALVSLGDLQLDRLGQPRSAARSYRRYLNKGGPLAQEARLGIVRAYRKLGDSSKEVDAIEAFVEHHPSSARVGQLRRRLSELRGR